MNVIFTELLVAIDQLEGAVIVADLAADYSDARLHSEILVSSTAFHFRKSIRSNKFNRKVTTAALDESRRLYLHLT